MFRVYRQTQLECEEERWYKIKHGCRTKYIRK